MKMDVKKSKSGDLGACCVTAIIRTPHPVLINLIIVCPQAKRAQST
jgi:hypothetical protein